MPVDADEPSLPRKLPLLRLLRVAPLGTWAVLAVVVGGAVLGAGSRAHAIGETSAIDLRTLDLGASSPARADIMRRLAWEVRKRTSIDTRLEPTSVRLTDASLFDVPFLYVTSDAPLPRFSDAEVLALRRFVDFGGFVFVDDGTAGGSEFDASVRRELGRVLPGTPLEPLRADHTVYRSFYLLSQATGRVDAPSTLEAIERAGHVAVLYARQDVGGALARDNLGNFRYTVAPGGDEQREMATRLAVNVVMYALCLDYKDDQVHVPFILRRRGSAP